LWRYQVLYAYAIFSAGVGRTGVFVTLSIILERMRYEGVVDMFQTVKILRTQRPAMVQSEVLQIAYAIIAISRFIYSLVLLWKSYTKKERQETANHAVREHSIAKSSRWQC